MRVSKFNPVSSMRSAPCLIFPEKAQEAIRKYKTRLQSLAWQIDPLPKWVRGWVLKIENIVYCVIFSEGNQCLQHSYSDINSPKSGLLYLTGHPSSQRGQIKSQRWNYFRNLGTILVDDTLCHYQICCWDHYKENTWSQNKSKFITEEFLETR